MTQTRCQAAVLISGSGTNLQALLDHAATPDSHYSIAHVLSNRADAYGLQRARQAGIGQSVIEHGDFDTRESFDRAMAAALDPLQPELIILAGFMRILSPWFVRHYAGLILNIHPALLPAYPGLNTHQRVIDAGESWHGSSVHFVTEELDGGPPVLQGRLAVRAGESAAALRDRVQALEYRIYPQAADWFGAGRLQFRDGQAWLDAAPLAAPVVQDFGRQATAENS